jgi:CBS-domain-containing membrane protein
MAIGPANGTGQRRPSLRAVASNRGGGTTAVREVMSEGLFTCYEDDSAAAAARLMAEHKVRRVPVVNRSDELVGMLSLADLARSGGKAAELAKDTLASITEPSPHAPRV